MNKSNRATRRDFLKTATAAAAAAPCIITSSMRRAGAAPANERLTVGVIGPGKRGRTLIRQFIRYPETQLVDIVAVEE